MARGASVVRFAWWRPGKLVAVPEPAHGCHRSTQTPETHMNGESRRARLARRAGVWLLWWLLLTSFWLIVDDSTAPDEVMAGAAAAVLGATLAELVTYQAGTRLRLRVRWLVLALGLPGQVLKDTGIVFAALWRRLAHGEQPPSGFREIPVRYGSDTVEGRARRALLVGGRSVAPNSFALGLDAEREVMVVHQLVVNEGRAAD